MINLIKKITMVVAVASCLTVPITGANAGGDIRYEQYDRTSSWRGFYLGGHVGGAFSNFGQAESYIESNFNNVVIEDEYFTDILSHDTDSNGFTGGIHLGYNFHKGNIVLGIEGDVSFLNTDISGTKTVLNKGDHFYTYKEKFSLDYLASLRGRLGYTHKNTLFYATAGIAWTEMDYSWSNRNSSHVSVEAFKKSLTGYVVGAGVEHKLWKNTSIRGEVLYYDFESTKLSTEDIDVEVDADTTVIRAGLTWHFD